MPLSTTGARSRDRERCLPARILGASLSRKAFWPPSALLGSKVCPTKEAGVAFGVLLEKHLRLLNLYLLLTEEGLGPCGSIHEACKH